MVHIFDEANFRNSPYLRKLKRFLSRILKNHGYGQFDMNLLLIDNAGIRIYNETYRKKEGATDVLSFSQLEGEESGNEEPLLGDVILSVEKAKSQSLEYGVSLFEEMTRLSIHGTLHLLGFDHENVSAEIAEEMYRLQNLLTDEFMKSIRIR